MRATVAAGIFSFFLIQTVVADAIVEQAQAALKQQGFYYGEVTGEKNADTTAAIRRFQIRSGLQVTGELNPETLQALNSSASADTAQRATPTPRASTSPPASTVVPTVPGSGQASPPTAPAAGSGFSNTPYDMAPPEVQRRVIRGAQVLLRRHGYFKGNIDAVYGPELEFSLRAYQSSIGISPTGRLDMDTLASLGLLPGQQYPARGFLHRRFPPRPFDEPPVRGEWIPEDRGPNEH